jgi:hypothetical protein
MLAAHLSVDLFFEGVLRPFYPLTSWELVAPQIQMNVIRDNWTVVSAEGFLLTLNALIVGLAYYGEQLIYFFESQHEKLEKALKHMAQS